MEKKRIDIDWNGPLQLAIVVAILFGANIPFYLISRNEVKAIEKEMNSFHKDMMDFHGRLVAVETKNEMKLR